MGDIIMKLKSKSIILFFVLSLMTLHLTAQSDIFDDGILVLRTGDSLRGQVKLSTKINNIIFAKNNSKKKIKFDSRKVKKVIMTGYDTNSYIYKIAEAGEEPKLLQEVIINDSISLLKDTRSYLKWSTGTHGFGETTNIVERKLKPVWFISKQNSDFVESIPAERKELLKRFNDCQDVMLKYRDYNEDKFFVIEFMRLYIENCASKNLSVKN